jgi:hypothetical protein
LACGRPSSHAASRSIWIAAAVARCWSRVFASPTYRQCRRPKARTPCESVPSIPARFASFACHSVVFCCCRSSCSAWCSSCGFRVIWRGFVFALVHGFRASPYRHSLYAHLTLITGLFHLSCRTRHDELVEGVSDLLISYQTDTPNSYRLIKRPITKSCMRSILEKQIVRRTNRLIRVRRLMCLLSIFCVFSFPTVCCSASTCRS